MNNQSKAFLLDQDLAENRQVRFWFNDTVVKQDNGTNPRIKRIARQTANEFMTISETLPDYAVRVVLGPKIPKFDLTGSYQIEWEPGAKTAYRVIDIKKSSEEGVYITLFLVSLK